MVDEQGPMLVSINRKYEVESYQHDQHFDSVDSFVSKLKNNDKNNKPDKTNNKKHKNSSNQYIRNKKQKQSINIDRWLGDRAKSTFEPKIPQV